MLFRSLLAPSTMSVLSLSTFTLLTRPSMSCSAHVRCFSGNDFLDFLGRTFPGGYDLEALAGSNFYPFPKCIARPLAAFFPSMAQSIFFLLRKKMGYTGSIVDYPRKHPLETNFWLG